MKLRYYLYGLGSGIIMAVLIMVVANKISAVNSNQANKGQEETSGSVIAYTTQSATQQSTENTTVQNTEITSAVIQTNTDGQPVNTQQADTTAQTNPANPAEQQTGATAAQAQLENTVAATVNPQDIVTIHIDSVKIGYDVAGMLKDKGVIEDADAFSRYMIDTGYSRSIQKGDFQFVKGDSFENILKILTGNE